jgi:hypothetical protein
MSTFLALLFIYVLCLGVFEFFGRIRRLLEWLFWRRRP